MANNKLGYRSESKQLVMHQRNCEICAIFHVLTSTHRYSMDFAVEEIARNYKLSSSYIEIYILKKADEYKLEGVDYECATDLFRKYYTPELQPKPHIVTAEDMLRFFRSLTPQAVAG